MEKMKIMMQALSRETNRVGSRYASTNSGKKSDRLEKTKGQRYELSLGSIVLIPKTSLNFNH